MGVLSRNTSTMTIASFYELDQLNKIDFDPEYQRKSVWGDEEKSFLIDTILKNFPIPPIFLHRGIDINTGNTKFSVIDGKQRLLAIKGFINGTINIPEDFAEGTFGNGKLNGLSFKDLKDDEVLLEYRKLFWRYEIPVEYIDTEDKKVVDNIFDRLNRNGLPLKEQELRKAKFNSEKLYKFIEELSENPFWETILENTVDTSRMVDVEFISELLFLMLEEEVQEASTPESINLLYERYILYFKSLGTEEIEKIRQRFDETTKVFEGFALDFHRYKINKVSHLYGLWALACYCKDKQIDTANLVGGLNTLFEALRNGKIEDPNIDSYKRSMSSNTRSKSQRKKRFDALKAYLEI